MDTSDVTSELKETLLLADQGDTHAALQTISAVVERMPESAAAWSFRGYVLGLQGQHPEALAAQEKAIALEPSNTGIWRQHGIALQQLQRYEEALGSFERAHNLDPKSALPWFNIADVLAYLGRDVEASAAYDRALSLKPDVSAAWIEQSRVLSRLGQFDRALAAADRAFALEVPPEKVGRSWYYKGVALQGLGRMPEALQAFEAAIAAGGKAPEVWEHKAQVLFALGHKWASVWAMYQRGRAQGRNAWIAWNTRQQRRGSGDGGRSGRDTDRAVDE